MEVGGGGLYATTEDNLRLMKLYADGGVWNGERILSSEYVALATTTQNASATESINNPDATDNFLGYGYQIWMCKPKGAYRADGAMGQFTIVVPDKDLIIAITENASGAHWAQKSLNVIWDFVETVTVNALPENPKAADSLSKRMAALALPAPIFSPYLGYDTIKRISGTGYTITDGSLFFTEFGRMNFMSGETAADGVSSLRFLFQEEQCTIQYSRSGSTGEILVACDGSLAQNELKSGVVSRALANGYWLDGRTFEMRIRWIETCTTRVYRFAFEDDTLRITVIGNGFMQPKEEIILGVAGPSVG
ncbi:hypothetical protein FACS18948_7470 [Clostridia bacterium]|nr:hypothetical protein FACS18948_7470 [Clostridia bacterium]